MGEREERRIMGLRERSKERGMVKEREEGRERRVGGEGKREDREVDNKGQEEEGRRGGKKKLVGKNERFVI